MDPEFAVKVITVSASGALAPGPLTAATTISGVKGGWKAGLSVAVGHTIVELPLVVAIAYGLSEVLSNQAFRFVLGLSGGAFMLFFGLLTLKGSLKADVEIRSGETIRGPVLTGAALSLFNPLFIMWWLGVGSPLIAEALLEGFTGILVFYATHVWLDYIWLIFIAAAGSFSRLDVRIYRLILATLALILIYFGFSMLTATVLR
ncbi:MAG: LysE family translocator [Thermofilaceae archaeon]|nr:LysE family translocator [Thermofilaceae archaeon]MDW8003441.1 LysE family transporter [Thermofilaceae archaeon]